MTTVQQTVRRSVRKARRVPIRVVDNCSARFGVVLYHRVAEIDVDPWGLAVDPVLFDEQLTAISSIGSVVPLEREALRHPFSRLGRRQRRIAITFDDGYADNLLAALPVLERHDAAATFFVATSFLGADRYWWDVFDNAVLDQSVEGSDVVEAARSTGLVDDGDAARLETADRETLHLFLYERMHGVSADAALDRSRAIARLLGTSSERSVAIGRPMTMDELATLAAHPLVTIGGHTARHPRLPTLSAEEARREIIAGNDALAQILGERPQLFAYPFGETNTATAAVARQAGVRRAFTTEHRWTSVADDSWLLPRMQVSAVNGEQLVRQLA